MPGHLQSGVLHIALALQEFVKRRQLRFRQDLGSAVVVMLMKLVPFLLELVEFFIGKKRSRVLGELGLIAVIGGELEVLRFTVDRLEQLRILFRRQRAWPGSLL